MNVTTMRNNILFHFKDKVKDGKFVEVTESGLYLGFQAVDSSQKPREGIVLVVGPKCTDVKVGDTILIEPLKWTEETKFGGEKFWLTTEDNVIGIVT
jgi:co-chaperonin GroES (HSP10)